MIALEMVYKYLNKTKNFRFACNPKCMELHHWSDAAYASHRDKRGHTGIMTILGFANAPIFAGSSTEAELALDAPDSRVPWLSTATLVCLPRQQIHNCCLRIWTFKTWKTQTNGCQIIFHSWSSRTKYIKDLILSNIRYDS